MCASQPVSDESRRDEPRRRQLRGGAELHGPSQRAELGRRSPAGRGGGAAVLGPGPRPQPPPGTLPCPRASGFEDQNPTGRPRP